MWETLLYIAIGAIAGVVRAVVTGKGLLMLPKIEEINGAQYINAGFLVSAIIGGFAGVIAPYILGVNCIVAALAGYVGEDLIENVIERALGYPRVARA